MLAAIFITGAVPRCVAESAKPWHIRLPRAELLEAWARLRAVEIPGVATDPRFALDAAPEFVVDPQGDDAADGSAERPWRTLRHAVAQLAPGTRVTLRAGTYHGPVTIATRASAESPAALRAAPGAEVIVTYPDEFVQSELDMLAAPDEIPEEARERRAVGKDGKPRHYPALITVTGTFVEVSGLRLVGVRDRLPHNLYSENGIALAGRGGHGCRIVGNEIENVGHCGIKEMGHGGREFVIDGNLVHNVGHTFHDHGIYIPGDDATLRRNLLLNATGWGVHAYSGPKRIVVEHTIMAGNDQHGIVTAGPDAVIRHNMFYRNNKGGIFLFRSGCRNNRIVNNMFIEKTAIAMDCLGDRRAYPSGNHADYNLLAPGAAFAAKAPEDVYDGGHTVHAEPLLTNSAALDFQPLPDCPSLGAGAPPADGAAAPNIGVHAWTHRGRPAAEGAPPAGAVITPPAE